MLAHYERVYTDIWNSVPRHFAKAARTGAGPFLRSQLDWLRSKAAARITGISQTLVDDVSDALMEGVREGHAPERIGAELEDRIPELTQARAATIARTETHTSATAAYDETIREQDIGVVSKTWWSAGDNRVRESHADVHGETVDLDEAFDVGLSQMMFPGDDSLGADADEIINCRCSVLYNTE